MPFSVVELVLLRSRGKSVVRIPLISSPSMFQSSQSEFFSVYIDNFPKLSLHPLPPPLSCARRSSSNSRPIQERQDTFNWPPRPCPFPVPRKPFRVYAGTAIPWNHLLPPVIVLLTTEFTWGNAVLTKKSTKPPYIYSLSLYIRYLHMQVHRSGVCVTVNMKQLKSNRENSFNGKVSWRRSGIEKEWLHSEIFDRDFSMTFAIRRIVSFGGGKLIAHSFRVTIVPLFGKAFRCAYSGRSSSDLCVPHSSKRE